MSKHKALKILATSPIKDLYIACYLHNNYKMFDLLLKLFDRELYSLNFAIFMYEEEKSKFTKIIRECETRRMNDDKLLQTM